VLAVKRINPKRNPRRNPRRNPKAKNELNIDKFIFNKNIAMAEQFHLFWESKSPFSQWYPCEFKDDDNTYSSAEQYMMYRKAKLFDDAETANRIMRSNSPKYVKSLGRQVKNFDQKIWESNRENIVTEGNLLKFSQSEHLRKYILKTKNKILVEASPYDKIWGIGLRDSDPRSIDPDKWRGLNLLGKCLMRVRTALSEEQ